MCVLVVAAAWQILNELVLVKIGQNRSHHTCNFLRCSSSSDSASGSLRSSVDSRYQTPLGLHQVSPVLDGPSLSNMPQVSPSLVDLVASWLPVTPGLSGIIFRGFVLPL